MGYSAPPAKAGWKWKRDWVNETFHRSPIYDKELGCYPAVVGMPLWYRAPVPPEEMPDDFDPAFNVMVFPDPNVVVEEKSEDYVSTLNSW
jgi:hypothetical protein